MLSKPKSCDASRSGTLLLRRWRRRECRLQTDSVVAKSSYQCCHQPVQNYKEEDSECVRHKERLLHISQRLSQKNLQDLLFLVHDVMPTIFDSATSSCTKLFQELQQKGHVGVNNYSKLKRWLVKIGRMDLARELPGTLTQKDQLSIAVDKKQQSHRFLMLQVSESLCKAEVQRLVYLCSVIPHKTITEGFQLFQELEQRGLISPDNYDYIAKCLRCIGREDLAYQLTHHNMDNSPHSFRQAEQMLRFFCRQKRQSYLSLLTELETSTTRQEWMNSLQALLPALSATWNRKASTAMIKAVHELPTSFTIDDVIHSTLKVVFTFFISEAQAISAVMKGNTRELRRCSEKCHSLYREFDEALEQIGWISSTRQKIAQLCTNRVVPCSCYKYADGLSTSIQSFCREFLGEERLQIEFENVKANIYKMESIYYHLCQMIAMMEWISDLICLGQISAVDLHKHVTTLTQLLSQHKHIITQIMPSISDIVDKEITDLATPLLSHALVEDFVDKTPLQTWSEDTFVTVLTKTSAVLLLELIVVANGHRINSHQVGEAYTWHMGGDSEQSSRIMTAGIKYGDSVKSLLYAQLAECKKSAVRVATRGPQGCSDVISELFQ